MVRKRAQAEKALSPPKEILSPDTRSSSSPEEAPRKRSKKDPIANEEKPNNKNGMSSIKEIFILFCPIEN